MLHSRAPVTVTRRPRREPLVAELAPAGHRGRCSDGKTKHSASRPVSVCLWFRVAAFLLCSPSVSGSVFAGRVCLLAFPILLAHALLLILSPLSLLVFSLLVSAWVPLARCLYFPQNLSLSCCLFSSFF